MTLKFCKGHVAKGFIVSLVQNLNCFQAKDFVGASNASTIHVIDEQTSFDHNFLREGDTGYFLDEKRDWEIKRERGGGLGGLAKYEDEVYSTL